MLTLTDKNFETEVIKATTPVLVDFWAPWCIDPAAYVLNRSNEWIRARGVRNGDFITSYSGRKLDGEKVTYSIESSKFGHCKEITTESGRSIRVTDEHTLFTKNGWKAAQELDLRDHVAVYPSPLPLSATPKRKRVIITKENVLRYALPSMRAATYIDELTTHRLIPLDTAHEKLSTIARLMGSLFTDGGLYQGKNHYRELHFTVGTKEDVEAIREDLTTLGFRIHTAERTTTRTIAGRTFTQHSFQVKCLSTAVWLFFRALGVPEGNKVEQGYRLPKWLFDASPLVQREFLAGYMGGDGPRVTMRLKDRPATNKQPYNRLDINDIEFYKTSPHATRGLVFARDIGRLFNALGIKIKDTFVENVQFPRKDGSTSTVIHIRFDQNFENAERLIRYVGYRYASDKDRCSRPVGEFLRRICEKRDERLRLYERAKRQYLQGAMLKKIADILNLPYDTIFGWLKKGNMPHSAYHRMKFPQWYRQVAQGLRGGLVWDRIRIVSSCYMETVQKITVEKHHNFIANEFLVHNCGPCKVMGPIIDALEKDYEGKPVKIAKMNVDENSATPGKFGVMSIPTFILFKSGKPVEQFVGIQKKEDLKKKIDALLK